MMNVSAIICELNPLHRGHSYIFSELKQHSDCVIAVMSGNFVQRGEAAVFDKYVRAKAAIQAGADLVCELPFPWSSASAAYFASAGTWIAAKLGAKFLYCGASQTDPDIYRTIAAVLEEYNWENTEKSAGVADARTRFVSDRLGEDYARYLHMPNDILAVEYCRAIQTQQLPLQLIPVQRLTSDENPDFVSASVIRQRLQTEGFANVSSAMPDFVHTDFLREWEAGRFSPRGKTAQLLFQWVRLRAENGKSPNTAEGEHGVLERLFRAADSSSSSSEMFAKVSTKKYTNARFRRAALFYMLQIAGEQVRTPPAYTLILAANRRGCDYLASLKHTCEHFTVTKPADYREKLSAEGISQFECAMKADRFYTLLLQTPCCADQYMKRSPYIDTGSFS